MGGHKLRSQRRVKGSGERVREKCFGPFLDHPPGDAPKSFAADEVKPDQVRPNHLDRHLDQADSGAPGTGETDEIPPPSPTWEQLRELRWGPGLDDDTPGIDVVEPDRAKMQAKLTEVLLERARESGGTWTHPECLDIDWDRNILDDVVP